MIQRRIHLLEKIGERNRLAVAGYHTVICDAFIVPYRYCSTSDKKGLQRLI